MRVFIALPFQLPRSPLFSAPHFGSLTPTLNAAHFSVGFPELEKYFFEAHFTCCTVLSLNHSVYCFKSRINLVYVFKHLNVLLTLHLHMYHEGNWFTLYFLVKL